MQLSDNFTLEELIRSNTADSKGIDNTPCDEVIENLQYLAETVLQPIRERYGRPISITSGYRCEKLNKAVGGVSNSQHKSGQAADIDVGDKEDNKELFNIIEDMVNCREIEVDQLLDEAKYKWIHISKKKSGNRNQILHL